jgi:hypothetical protein
MDQVACPGRGKRKRATRNIRMARLRYGRGRLADRDYVLSGGALLALYDVKFNLVAVIEGLEALGLDRAVVDEAVLGTIVRRDKTKAL